jgi:hypothetical protein
LTNGAPGVQSKAIATTQAKISQTGDEDLTGCWESAKVHVLRLHDWDPGYSNYSEPDEPLPSGWGFLIDFPRSFAIAMMARSSW